MTYDDIIHAIKEFGPYQHRILLLLCLPLISCGFHTMVGVFLEAQPDFRCSLPYESPENATYKLPPNMTNTTYPAWNNEIKNLPQCEIYDPNFTDPHNYSTEQDSFITPATRKCDSFVYDKTTFKLTTTTEFNVVCDNAWLIATPDALLLVGMMLGSMIFGGTSDRYGRRPILCLSLLIQAFSGLLVAVSPDIISYMIFRMIVGSTTSGTFIITYAYVVEMTVPKRRLMVGTVVQLFFSLGHVLIAGFAYFITNWRILEIAMTVPNLMFLVYWWLIPESARWLVSTGRLEAAKDLIQKAALENGVKLFPDRLDGMLNNCNVTQSDLEKLSTFDLLRYPNLRRKSLLLFLNFFVINSTYYGLSWNTTSLSGNVYINFSISGLVEIPAHIFALFTLNRWGRRYILCVTLLLAGTSLLMRIFVPNDTTWLEIVLTMIGKLAVTASFSTVYVFATEQFPTVTRNVGMGACSVCGMIGGILASYINYSSIFWKPAPVVIFGSCSLIAGLSTLLLPETLNEKLPETIQDGEQIGKSAWISRRKINRYTNLPAA